MRYLVIRYDNDETADEAIKLIREGKSWDIPSPDEFVGEATEEPFSGLFGQRTFKVGSIG